MPHKNNTYMNTPYIKLGNVISNHGSNPSLIYWQYNIVLLIQSIYSSESFVSYCPVPPVKLKKLLSDASLRIFCKLCTEIARPPNRGYSGVRCLNFISPTSCCFVSPDLAATALFLIEQMSTTNLFYSYHCLVSPCLFSPNIMITIKKFRVCI